MIDTLSFRNNIFSCRTNFINNAAGSSVRGVFLWLSTACITIYTACIAHQASANYPIGFEPYATRDQNIFNLLHGQALPTNASLIDRSQSKWNTSLVITNTLNIESNNNESIYLDYESYRFNLSYQYGLSKNWNLKLDVPLVHTSGGVFDSAIDDWHKFFNMDRGSRPYVVDNQYRINYAYRNQTLVDLEESSTTIGDIQLAIAHTLKDEEASSMSVWASVKLPTGDEDYLSGSGAADISAWFAMNQAVSNNWFFNLNAGAVILGQNEFNNMPLSDYTLYGHAMLNWLPIEGFSLKLQLQGHSSYYDESQLKRLGDTAILIFGGTIMINQCQQIDIAMNEDIIVDASPDASLLISWHHFPGAC